MESKKTVAISALADELVALCINKNERDMKETLEKYMEDKDVSLKGNSLHINMSEAISSVPSRGRGRPRKCVVLGDGVVLGVELDRKLYVNLWSK
jgi:hypothetical protein